jgi:tRNA (cmo5U34)-methyltransferase
MTPDLSPPRDRIYAEPLETLEDFVFDARVAEVFPDMVRRSVPGYASLIPLIGLVAAEHLPPGGWCYDLGCSLGAASLALRREAGPRTGQKQAAIVAVDNSLPMLQRLRELLAREAKPGLPIHPVCADIRAMPTPSASVVILNFTLQFIAPEHRDALLARLYRDLRSGGLLILSEKVRFEEPGQDTRFTALHHAFKRANGYSDLEISQKRSALERVLRPDSPEQLDRRLAQAGFAERSTWFQCLSFLSFLAWKP